MSVGVDFQRFRMTGSLLCLSWLLSCDGCATQPPPTIPTPPVVKSSPVQFRDRARDWNVDFSYRNSEEDSRYAIVETLGGGVGLFDFDRDGRLDIWCVGGGRFQKSGIPVGIPGQLFWNRVGSYRELTHLARLDRVTHYQHGVSAADFDQDGWIDVIVTGYGGLQLWHNLGDGSFEDVTQESGLAVDSLWSSSAAWGDFNRDGQLDLYVAHYVDWSPQKDPPCYTHGEMREVCSPIVFEGLPDSVFQSGGDGRFRDVSAEIGLVDGGKGMSALVADLDLDGDVDVYVGNDTTPRFLYENNAGKLTERGLISGVSLSREGSAEGSMGTDLGDYDLDGLPDLWVANYEDEMFGLHRNLGGLQFAHVSKETDVDKIGRAFVGWGVVFADWNLDGDEDVFVSNGHVVRHAHRAPIKQYPLLMENLQGQRFRNIADDSGPYFRTAHPGRGAAAGDIDLDGDFDLVVSNINQPVAVLENQGPLVGHSLSVELIGTQSPRTAIGTIVRLFCSESLQIRQWRGGGSFASTGDFRLLFGIPPEQSAKRLEIHWSSGLKQTVDLKPETKSVCVVEGGGHMSP